MCTGLQVRSGSLRPHPMGAAKCPPRQAPPSPANPPPSPPPRVPPTTIPPPRLASPPPPYHHHHHHHPTCALPAWAIANNERGVHVWSHSAGFRLAPFSNTAPPDLHGMRAAGSAPRASKGLIMSNTLPWSWLIWAARPSAPHPVLLTRSSCSTCGQGGQVVTPPSLSPTGAGARWRHPLQPYYSSRTQGLRDTASP